MQGYTTLRCSVTGRYEANVDEHLTLSVLKDSDVNEADLAELLWRASRGESCEHLRPRPTTKRSGRRSGRVETYVAAAGNTSNTQDAGAGRPTQDTIQLKRTAWSRVQELRSPPKHRVMAVVDVDAWASHPHTSDGPVPYWLTARNYIGDWKS